MSEDFNEEVFEESDGEEWKCNGDEPEDSFERIDESIEDLIGRVDKDIYNSNSQIFNRTRYPLALRLSPPVSKVLRVARTSGNFTVSVKDKMTGQVIKQETYNYLNEANGQLELWFVEYAIKYGTLRDDCSLGPKSYETMFGKIDIFSNENGRCFQYVPVRVSRGLIIMKRHVNP